MTTLTTIILGLAAPIFISLLALTFVPFVLLINRQQETGMNLTTKQHSELYPVTNSTWYGIMGTVLVIAICFEEFLKKWNLQIYRWLKYFFFLFIAFHLAYIAYRSLVLLRNEPDFQKNLRNYIKWRAIVSTVALFFVASILVFLLAKRFSGA